MLTSQDVKLALDTTLRRVGDHYTAIGEHSDLWEGFLGGSGWIWRSQRKVAIKLLRGGSINKPNFKDRLIETLETHGSVWKEFQHTNVARFHGLAFDCGILPALILDFYPNGNINEYIKKQSLDDQHKLALMAGVARGMRYLHSFEPSVIHGDIRGANILIDAKGQAVLADYELAFIIDSSDFTTTKIAGTCRWTAPELMTPPEDEEEHNPPYSFATDVFAFAMTIIEVFTGKPPFSEKRSDSAVLFAIVGGKRPSLPEYIQGKEHLARFVERCWHKDKEERPSADDICKLLETELNPPSTSGWKRFLPLSGYFL